MWLWDLQARMPVLSVIRSSKQASSFIYVIHHYPLACILQCDVCVVQIQLFPITDVCRGENGPFDSDMPKPYTTS